MKTSADKCAAAGCYTAGISRKTIIGLAEALQALLIETRAHASDRAVDRAVSALRNSGIAVETRAHDSMRGKS